MIRFDIDAKGLDKAIRDVSDFIADVKNRKDVMQEIKQEQIDRWAENFQSFGAEYEPWRETSKSYREQRVREGYASSPTLYRSGRTFAHFLQQNEAGQATNSAVNWSFTNRIAGRNGAYTVSHHSGYQLGKSTVPARVLWDLDEEDEDRVEADLEQWLDQLGDKHFG
jgi:phage gpG-like protein